jgi:hypothetical protein
MDLVGVGCFQYRDINPAYNWTDWGKQRNTFYLLRHMGPAAQTPRSQQNV